MICPPDVLCKWKKDEMRYETMSELARELESERNTITPRRLRLADAKEAARIEQWLKRQPPVVIEPEPTPLPKPILAITPESLMDRMVEEFKRRLCGGVLLEKKGNQTVAAKALGIHRNTMNRIVRGRRCS